MRIYSVHLYLEEDGSQGFKFCSSKREAKAIAAEFTREWAGCNMTPNPTIEEVAFTPNKHGILALLRKCASHPDNG